MIRCEWCGADEARKTDKVAYWELHDGLRAVEIRDIPSIHCSNCEMHYLTEDTIDQIEDQLMLIDIKKLANTFTYQELMDQPRLLAKNYFKF
ncbi:YokU family protein [Desertibacillus haloalkaliphilus]|uniref:YokU family protein n=1 Tax=Desertibacillus haloalkaliphilus TaxID=1328930 RepID=UPI001C27245B|nr:YokU family protein [Desertibacillus haloalkaliphilus]MBU8908019.1 YokU family protein [Desertibacillus haloalkaliphilus]